MKQAIKNFSYYVILPSLVVGGLVLVVFCQLENIENSVSIALNLIQAFAIISGGLWAYKKFDWGKRAESAIELKALLMEYEKLHNEAAMQYRIDQKEKKEWMECWLGYSMKMLPIRNQFVSKIHLSAFIPQRVRQKLFDTTWLSVNKGQSPKSEDLDENWKKFSIVLKELHEELDKLVTK